MDNYIPNPDTNHTSDTSAHREDHLSGLPPPSRASERKAQFGWGCTLWVPVIFVTPVLALVFQPVWVFVFLGVPLFGLIAAVWLVVTEKRRWFGIGMLTGFLLFGLIWGLIFWEILTNLSSG